MKSIRNQLNSIWKQFEIKLKSNNNLKFLCKTDIFEYLRHLNGEEDEEERSDNESHSTNDGFEDKIKSLEELIKENGEIKYKII